MLLRLAFVKPKFHYAFCDKVRDNVADFVADTNHESPWHKSRRQLSWFVSRTFTICVHDRVRWALVADFPCALSRT